jgi:hypothetical protein
VRPRRARPRVTEHHLLPTGGDSKAPNMIIDAIADGLTDRPGRVTKDYPHMNGRHEVWDTGQGGHD